MFFIIFFKYIKIYQLNITKKIKTLQKKLMRDLNLSKEEKQKKEQYSRERNKNLSEEEKNKLVEYRQKYYRMRKNP